MRIPTATITTTSGRCGPYRDWVIRALNVDMPFDQFTIEQLAGDLLPDPTLSQLVATGFHRNVPTNFSGGSKVPEVRADILHDRVATTGTVWMGMTTKCAQCHDHKFDALTQREYYQLYAYFNQAIPEFDQQGEGMFRKHFIGGEVIVYQSDNHRQHAKALLQALATEESRLANLEQSEDEDDLARAGLEILDFEGEDSVASNNTSHPASTSLVGDTPAGGGESAARTVVEDSPRTGSYFGTGFSFPAVDLSGATEISFWIKTDIASAFNFQVHNNDNRVSIFGFSTREVEPGTWTQITAPVRSFTVPPWSGGEVNWSEVSKCQVTAYGSAPYADKYIMLDSVVGLMPSERELHRKRIADLEEELAGLQTATMIMRDATHPPVTHVMIRGDYATPGERVETGVPAALHVLDPSLPQNRLGLAMWLVDPENPLTARVTVNRVWAEIFGQGLVPTLEDFGMQGEQPTHPDLLDWLAIRFIEDGWSLKNLIRTVVTSSTYQQTSTTSEERIHLDPQNRWYARGSRFRLSAELVRDHLLAVSGLLCETVGGPPVYPVQPPGLWKEISGPVDVTDYPTSEGDDLYRRSLYTIWRRGNPYPSMITFDAPDRSTCAVRRDRSNTPLQALTLLNDPVYVEMAVEFARTIESWDGSDQDRIVRAFRRAMSRRPSEGEVNILLELFQKDHSWFAVAQVLLNLDETISKS